MQEYNICYSLDSNYVEQLAVSITSILKNADNNDNINIYILDGGLTNDDKNKLELLKNIKPFHINYLLLSDNEFKNCPLLAKKDEKYKDYHVTLPTYYRFKIPSLLPNLSKVLYLDCDVIVRTSLKSLFEIPVNNNSVAMVLDSESLKESKRLGIDKYYNAGVMLINLDYWRKNNIEQQLFDCAKNNKDIILWQDQDVVNIVLNKSIKEINNIWNYQYFQYEKVEADELANVSIMHLAGRFKPWLMPFESNIYDEYYFYLFLTPWKNNVIKYKQNSFGKHLKNQTGGCITNIRLNATDEDIQKCYSEIDGVYSFVKEQLTVKDKKNDEKIDLVYEEITKNYKYTDELSNNLSNEIRTTLSGVDKKITDAQSEITKNSEYTNEKVNSVEKQTNEKISNIYEEIAKNYEFTKEQVKEASYSAEKSTNEKIDLVYEEITKNYKYTDELSNNLSNEIRTTLSGVDKKITDAQSEITKNSEYTNEKVNSVEKQTNEKISNIYEEIAKNYEFTKEQVKEASYSAEKSTNEKIDLVYEEITKNYKYTDELSNNLSNAILSVKESVEKNNSYTEYLVESSAEKQAQNLEEAIEEVKKEIAQKENDIYRAIDNTYISTDEKLMKLEEVFNGNISELNSKINQDLTHRFREIYLYSNDNFSKLYKGLKEFSAHLENIMTDKVNNLYRNEEELEQKINTLKGTVESCSELVATVAELKSELIKQNIDNNSKLEALKKSCEDELNQQRIKYEKKLMHLEDMINESRKNPLVKFIEKIKKR